MFSLCACQLFLRPPGTRALPGSAAPLSWQIPADFPSDFPAGQGIFAPNHRLSPGPHTTGELFNRGRSPGHHTTGEFVKSRTKSRPPYHGRTCKIAEKVYNSSWFRMKIVTLYESTLASGLHISWRCQIIVFLYMLRISGYNMVIKVSLYVCVCTWRWIFDVDFNFQCVCWDFSNDGNVERIQYFRHASVFWLQMTCRMDPNMEQYFNLTIQLLYLNTYPTKSVNVLLTAKATFRGLFFFLYKFISDYSIYLSYPPPPPPLSSHFRCKTAAGA